MVVGVCVCVTLTLAPSSPLLLPELADVQPTLAPVDSGLLGVAQQRIHQARIEHGRRLAAMVAANKG